MRAPPRIGEGLKTLPRREEPRKEPERRPRPLRELLNKKIKVIQKGTGISIIK